MPLSSRARSRRPWRLSVRARGLDRAACDLLAGRCAAAAARRALAGRLLCASHLWRNGPLLATCSCAGCWLVLEPRRHGLLDRDVRQSSLIVVPGFICKSVVACWHNQHEGWLHQRVWRAQPPDLADFSCTRRTASSRSSVRCADRRRRLRAAKTSGAVRRAVLLLLCCWPSGARARACGS